MAALWRTANRVAQKISPTHESHSLTDAKHLLKVLDLCENAVRNKDTLRLLRRDCDAFVWFLDEHGNYMTSEEMKMSTISDIMQIFTEITGRMKKWAKAGAYTNLALNRFIERDIKYCRETVNHLKKRFHLSYSIDISQLVQDDTTAPSPKSAKSPISPTRLSARELPKTPPPVDYKSLNPTLRRISARGRKSSMPSSPVSQASPAHNSPSAEISMLVEHLPPTPTRPKRKSSHDAIDSKRRKISDKSVSLPLIPIPRSEKVVDEGHDKSPTAKRSAPPKHRVVRETKSLEIPLHIPPESVLRGGHRLNTPPNKPATNEHPPGWTTAREQLHTHEQEFSELYHEFEVITIPGPVESGTAKRLDDNLIVAVKRIKFRGLHSTFLRRFIDEFNNTIFRQHDKLVNYNASFLENEGLLVVMDHVNSVSLRNVIDANPGRMTEQHIASILRNITEAVVHLHAKNLPHGTIDSHNVLLSTGNDASVRLNLCAMFSGYEPGRPAAPIDVAADVWALGMLAIEMLDKSTHVSGVGRSDILRVISSFDPYPSPKMHQYLTRAFDGDVKRRVTASQLLQSPFLAIGTSTFSLRFLIMNAFRSLRSKDSQAILK